MTPDIFGAYLARRGILFTRTNLDEKQVYIVESYAVPHGRFAGRIVGIGLPIPPDFPTSAPYGLHVRSDHGFEGGIQAVNESGLGPGWSFWSREIRAWDGCSPRAAEMYMDHVDRWLEVE